MIPKVSICIPTYCQVDFLRQTLNSIVEQKYTDYEIIISDDSPNDSVKSLLLEFNFGKKLHYFSNDISLGSPENWNAATHRAKGEYIKILHHDDKLAHSDALGEFVRMLDNNPNADFGFSASRVEDIQSKSIREHRPTTKQIQMMSTMPEKLFLGNCIGAPSATIYRRKAAMGYDNRMKWLVDIDFYIRVLQRNKNFSYNPEILISTPTNANHQVTEVCKNDAQIELYEYSILYLKNAKFLSDEREVISFLLTRIGKYGINAIKNVISVYQDEPYVKEFLEGMLQTYSRRPLLRIVHFIYWRLPAPVLIQKVIRLFIQFNYKIFLKLKIALKKIRNMAISL